MSDRLKRLLDDLEGFPADATIGELRNVLRARASDPEVFDSLMRQRVVLRRSLSKAKQDGDLAQVASCEAGLQQTRACLESMLPEPVRKSKRDDDNPKERVPA